MKTYAVSILLGIFWIQVHAQDWSVRACADKPNEAANPALQDALETLVKTGIPGAVAVVYKKGKFEHYAAGCASIEDRVPMGTCQGHYLQSIAKLYLAVTVMQLSEMGKVELDQKIGQYLPAEVLDLLPDSEQITVRMLLNHTSGLPEYNDVPLYVTRLLQNPDKVFEPMELLGYVNSKKLDFEPGSRYSYRNTNYLVLALLMDHLTLDHVAFMKTQIFDKLGLQNTFYRISPESPAKEAIVQSYWDRFSDGKIENISQFQWNNVASMIGDDGIISTTEDAILFLRGLMEGRLISENSLREMKSWVKTAKGVEEYGLGLDLGRFAGQEGMGHSGGGLGSGTQLYYFPEKDLYVFMGINLGTVTASPIHEKAEEILEHIYQVLLK
ncbi:serine hydrolase domain-containing protein [Mariniradius sediminis]|uniref:Beta-lactamase family protein n=1 Tax=Mariniradius sediminis TaxID=2909237 RepID=A0ABS9BW67_9BACT|nr:serine hydrolase domain-containing protein [Mariniradius sediminis]MCF1752306.1 beta-lactamase family protein [Mariniradius sediminis]